jgi:hypothetical protein
MAKAKLTLYVDIVSPFGYMAYYMLRVSRTGASQWPKPAIYFQAFVVGRFRRYDYIGLSYRCSKHMPYPRLCF